MPIIPIHLSSIGLQFSIAAVMIMATVTAHVFFLDFIFRLVDRFVPYFKIRLYRSWRSFVMVCAVIIIFFSHVVHIWLWAYLFLWIDGTEIDSLEEALYFSITTYTTLGYGDVVLQHDWRLLGSTEAFNGILLLGLSTAALFELLLRIYGTGRTQH